MSVRNTQHLWAISLFALLILLGTTSRGIAAPPNASEAQHSAGATTQPAQASQPARTSRRHTAPSDEVLEATLGSSPAAIGPRKTMTGPGREAGESKVAVSSSVIGASSGAIGRTGLSAPQPGTLSAAGPRPGLQRGYAAGLGFAGPRTIFTMQRNPIASPCRSLVRSGFFPNQGACEARFRR